MVGPPDMGKRTLNTSGFRAAKSQNGVSSLTSRPLIDFALDRALVERELEEMLSGPEVGPVREAMRYAVFSGGQRIRPLLVLRVARVARGSAREAALPA